jgi:hypothetical protein
MAVSQSFPRGYNRPLPQPVRRDPNFLPVTSVRTDPRGPVYPLPRATTRAATPPVPGTIAPGELLVAATDRSMWLGVDASVDIAQALLLSDIQALMQTDADNLTAAKAYTDQQILTRAPLTHTHTSTEITDFVPAVEAIVGGGETDFKRGMIMPFSGDPGNIGQDWSAPGHVPPGVNLIGWALCDGNNPPAPNLLNRFIIGHGTRTSGSSNTIDPNNLKQTGSAGGHNHGLATGFHQLTANEIPPHTHPYTNRFTYNGIAGHEHYLMDFGVHFTGSFQLGGGTTLTLWRYTGGGSLPVRASDPLIAIGANSTSWAPHNHAIAAQADHSHSFPADTAEAVPYFVLAYMMKL